MLKFIIFELLKCYMTKEKKCYSDYAASIFATLCLVSLIIANYFYFYLEDRMVGNFIICSTACILVALILKAYSRYSNSEEGSGLPSLVATGAEKVIPYLPTLIRFVPISLVTFTVWSLLKGRFLKLKK